MTGREHFALALLCVAVLSGCADSTPADESVAVQEEQVEAEAPEYFLLRPDVEKAYGYSHAVRIGDDIKISGAVSMDDAGNPTAVGDLEQQMKNAYSDLDKVLQHYGYSFDDVVVENIYTTDMARFLEVASYRTSIYANHFPTGTWLEVEGLAVPEFMIEIELEAHRSR
jgi:enamine deaminase RidA (YjgF/YER057c/UK114 family)